MNVRGRFRQTHAKVAAHADGSLRLAVVADTHSALHPATTTHLAALRPDTILHAGDIGDRTVLGSLRRIAPVFAVRGNIDGRARDLPDAAILDIVSGGAPVLRILLLHIAVDGTKLRADAARLAHSHSASLVVCGHSHIPLIARDGDIAVFNPGSAGPRRFALPVVFGTIDVSHLAVHLAHFACESGRPWNPASRTAAS
ncbi:MAG TPA: metallophosphoesterase family protein [Polyangiaceae bacterium]|nr:metallophosphoesterase family protein [Polyangiaceae bacterium]